MRSTGIVVPYDECSPTPIVRCALRPSAASRICQVPPETEVAAAPWARAIAAVATVDIREAGDAEAGGSMDTDTTVAAARGATTTTARASASRRRPGAGV